MTATHSFLAQQVVLNSVQYTQFSMGVSGANSEAWVVTDFSVTVVQIEKGKTAIYHHHIGEHFPSTVMDFTTFSLPPRIAFYL
jgi:hypothetical protein